MTYVDDILITGPKRIKDAIRSTFEKTWKTSGPEEISDGPVKFLGMEISRTKEEDTGRWSWMITQEGYATDLLESEPGPLKHRKIPITRDQASMEEDDSPPSQAEIKASQKAVGEMLWLVTRSRPDMMYAVSRMGSNILKAPRAVLAEGISCSHEEPRAEV